MVISLQLTTQNPTLEMCEGRAEVFFKSSIVRGTKMNPLESKISSPLGSSLHVPLGQLLNPRGMITCISGKRMKPSGAISWHGKQQASDRFIYLPVSLKHRCHYLKHYIRSHEEKFLYFDKKRKLPREMIQF